MTDPTQAVANEIYDIVRFEWSAGPAAVAQELAAWLMRGVVPIDLGDGTSIRRVKVALDYAPFGDTLYMEATDD